jgi:hypothetical protein
MLSYSACEICLTRTVGQTVTGKILPPFGGDKLPPHQPIAQKTVPGIPECSWAILLKHKVANPGKTVANQGQHPPQCPVATDEQIPERRQHQRRPQIMQRPATGICVFAQIIGIKLPKRLKSLRHSVACDKTAARRRPFQG